MPAQLVSLAEGPNILLDKPIVLIGRHEECDIQLNSRKISRKHCCIAQVNDYLVVRDLGSTNGVRINGVRANEGTLHTGDELTIGNYRYQIQGESSPLPALARPVADEKTAPPPGFRDAFDSGDEPIPLSDPAARPAPKEPGDSHHSGPPIAPANDLPLASPSSFHLPPPAV